MNSVLGAAAKVNARIGMAIMQAQKVRSADDSNRPIHADRMRAISAIRSSERAMSGAASDTCRP